MNRSALVALLTGHIVDDQGQDATLGVMLIRLQRLREFRLVYGYAASDALSEAAQIRIEQVLRPVDVVSRIGEYEFVVLLPGLHDRNHAALAGSRVVRAFHDPLSIDTRSVLASVAIGISVFPEHGADAETLLRRAELALGDAERTNERSILYKVGSEKSLIPYEWLHEAIVANRLEVYLQPILDLKANQIVGAESLARWNELGRGMIAPDAFIPLAEETGLISELTRWSLNATLRHASIARGIDPALSFSINLSPRVFGQRDIISQIMSALSIWGVPPEAVTLEVTENALMEDPDMSLKLLRHLRDEGLCISIDDFGAGYSSLAYLKHFPATELKIDRAFVIDMQRDARSVQVVRSIIDLGHHMQLGVVAEGVEDAVTLEMLRHIGCDRAQGFHIRRPAPAAEVIAELGRSPLPAIS
ncbi:MAG: bifunctional diguanylate cyclase/phosphodiesterase [Lysobacter sp.]|nr:bifunctional diguanylate cyclase/phosphodiesterase [Lysobacter sp.]